MSTPAHTEADDYIGPHEDGHELVRAQEPDDVSTREAEEYVGPHPARELTGRPEGLLRSQR